MPRETLSILRNTATTRRKRITKRRKRMRLNGVNGDARIRFHGFGSIGSVSQSLQPVGNKPVSQSARLSCALSLVALSSRLSVINSVNYN
eukprot:1165276-Heterocapsa_arctica.AAC.1